MMYRHSRPATRYRTMREDVKDSERLTLRKGDIVKFDNGIMPNDYREWFLLTRDRQKHLMPPEGIPKYAMNQYAIIVNRYKVTKFKYSTFVDYGSEVMMLTGKSIGRTRCFYAKRPFRTISEYPHKKRDTFYIRLKKPFKVVDNNLILGKHNLSDSLSEIYSEFGENEEGRNLFLSRLQLIMKSEEII